MDLPVPQVPFALDLSFAKLTGSDVAALGRFSSLQSLNLVSTELQDDDLRTLGGLEELRGLTIGGNMKITDAGLKLLLRLKNLQLLSIGVTGVTAAGIKELAAIESLRTLRLYSLDLTASDCKELARLKQLRVLDVHLNKITDAGLKELASLENLELLNVAATDVTDAGLAEIRKALPKCEVQR